jgi:hypothetical protein
MGIREWEVGLVAEHVDVPEVELEEELKSKLR